MAGTLAGLIEVAVLVGLLYAPITLGLALSFRLLNYPDLTCEGSIMLAGAVAIMVLSFSGSIIVSICLAVAAGGFAGMLTGLFHVYFRTSRLLSGIITTAMLYSVAIRFQGGRANIRADRDTLFDALNAADSSFVNLSIVAMSVSILLLVVILLYRTRLGRILRALGDNELFVVSIGCNPKIYLIAGLAIANAAIGFGSGILVHFRGVCDVNMAFGTLIAGLAAMVLGEALFAARRLWQHAVFCVAGTVIYNIAIGAFYFDWGVTSREIFLASDVRFATGALLLIPALLLARRRTRYRLFRSEW